MIESGMFSGDRIRELLVEVADYLKPEKPQATVLIVGGSLLAWHELRSSTEDVDTSLSLDADLKNAVRRVAEINGLEIDWLNDHSAPWHPQTLRIEDCDVLIDHPRLRVLGAPLHAVFLMKLNRSQPQDVVDILTLWPLVLDVFPNARAVSDAYYSAFPVEEIDEFLTEEIVELARRAGIELPLE